jgi:hypothetical protein
VSNPFRLRAEQREFEQQYYGGYCNQARAKGIEPMSYVKFQFRLGLLLGRDLTKKQIMNELLRSDV